MAVLLSLKDLKEFKKEHKTSIIGVTFSCWDLLHAGHNIFLDDERVPNNVTWIKLPSVDFVVLKSYNEIVLCPTTYENVIEYKRIIIICSDNRRSFFLFYPNKVVISTRTVAPFFIKNVVEFICK